ncbi:MAG: DNA alkylation repair protein [Lachnospiraceae bacterium]|nr:DNA alkylation repair protein [Lachnospiraceae bacterium]
MKDPVIMAIQNELSAMAEEKNAAFQQKLTPGLRPECFLGIRVPMLRAYAKRLMKTSPNDCEIFLQMLPHTYYDENMLHAILLAQLRDFDRCVEQVEHFLPHIDNWAVCDTLRPAVFKKHTEALLPKVRGWVVSDKTYTCRFGVGMLLSYYLDDKFSPEYLGWPADISSKEYYVNMMIAWYYATALAKQWESTIPYLEENRLPLWVHNKTIQKARESFRITQEQKEYLQGLKREWNL